MNNECSLPEKDELIKNSFDVYDDRKHDFTYYYKTSNHIVKREIKTCKKNIPVNSSLLGYYNIFEPLITCNGY